MGEASNLIVPPTVAAALRAIGQALSRARRARGDTQDVAGERCGLHFQTVGRIERGDPTVGIGSVFSLMAIYGMSERLFDLGKDNDETRLLAVRALPKRGRRQPRAE